jgi:hypothetical protein
MEKTGWTNILKRTPLRLAEARNWLEQILIRLSMERRFE